MTEQDFLNKALEHCKLHFKISYEDQQKHGYDLRAYRGSYCFQESFCARPTGKKIKKALQKFVEPTFDDYLYMEWRSGGVGGGSCWNDDSGCNYYPIEPEPEPEFEDLDWLLTEICPQISFLQYKRILSKIEHDSYSINEYYGNSTSYAIKVITLRNLYNELKDMKVI